MSTRSPSPRARSTTRPPAGVNLKPLFNKFITAEASSCGSALTASRGSTSPIVELQPAEFRVEAARVRDLVEKRPERYALLPPDVRRHANVRQRAVDQVAQVDEAAAQHRAGAAVDRDRAALERVKGEQRRVEVVPDLVSELPGAFDFSRRS